MFTIYVYVEVQNVRQTQNWETFWIECDKPVGRTAVYEAFQAVHVSLMFMLFLLLLLTTEYFKLLAYGAMILDYTG